jgi:acyl carrier protein
MPERDEPENAVVYQRALSEILRDVLEHDALGADDDFFALGGDSLRAIEVSRRVQDELGLKLELVDVFTHPSARALAELLAARGQHAARGVPLAARACHPASAVQRGLYLLDELTSRHDAAVLPVVIELGAAVDPELAAAAFRRVLERHEILRTTFALEHGALQQRVRPLAAMPPAFEHTDLTALASPVRSLRAIYEAAAKQPFDLEAGPLVRLHVVCVSPASSVALLSIHHIVSDAFSAAILERDLRWAHDELAGRTVLAHGLPEPEPLAFHYKDYVRWLDEWIEGPAGRRALEHWLGALAGLEPPPASVPAIASFAAARSDGPLPGETVARLERASVEHEVTLFVVLLSCITVLSRLRTGTTDVVIGVAASTRDAIPLSGQIGPYVNTLPIRTRVAGQSTFAGLVSAIDRTMLAALAHKLLPLETLAAARGDQASLFDVGFTMQQRGVSPPAAADWLAGDTLSDALGIGLLFVAYDGPAGLALRIRYQTARFTADEIHALRAELESVIGVLCDRPEVTLDELLAPRSSAAGRFIDLDLDP